MQRMLCFILAVVAACIVGVGIVVAISAVMKVNRIRI